MTNFWDRLDCPPYIKPLSKCITPPSTLSTVRKNEGGSASEFNSTKSPPKKQASVESELQVPMSASASNTSAVTGGDVRSESPVPAAFNNRLSTERASINSARNFAESGMCFFSIFNCVLLIS